MHKSNSVPNGLLSGKVSSTSDIIKGNNTASKNRQSINELKFRGLISAKNNVVVPKSKKSKSIIEMINNDKISKKQNAQKIRGGGCFASFKNFIAIFFYNKWAVISIIAIAILLTAGSGVALSNLILNSMQYDELTDYVYFGEEQIDYLTDITTTHVKQIRDASGVIKYELDHQGDPISLYSNEQEVVFDKGISMAGGATCFTIINIQEWGFETFETYVGVHSIARDANSTTTSFEFRIELDGEIVYTYSGNSAYAEMEHVVIDLTGVDGMLLYINNLGSTSGDYAAYGDPLFRRSSPSAYMDVFDMEFNLPSQVTELSILEYASATDFEGNDISNDIKYRTNYVAGEIGEFDLTYYVYDSRGIMRRRDVKLTVTGQDYSDQDWTVEDYKTPYVDYMYHPRQAHSTQMKKAFDMSLEAILNFDQDANIGGATWGTTYRTAYGATYYTINMPFLANGIYLTYADISGTTIPRALMDAEPRAFMLQCMDIFIYYSTDTTTGLITSWRMFALLIDKDVYDARIDIIMENGNVFLDEAVDGMTEYQKFYYVVQAYGLTVSYGSGATLWNSMGTSRQALCSGNSMGTSYLAMRLNIKSIYSEGNCYAGFHAWTYQKFPNDVGWYLTDRLWYTVLCYAGYGNVSTHVVSTSRGYSWFLTQNEIYPRELLTYTAG